VRLARDMVENSFVGLRSVLKSGQRFCLATNAKTRLRWA